MVLNKRLESLLKSNNLLNHSNDFKSLNVDELIYLISNEFDFLESEKRQISKDIEKLKVVLDTTPCTVSWISRDLKYVGVNKTLAELCNLQIEDFVGKIIGYYSKDNYFYNFSKRLFENPENSIREELIGNIDGQDKTFWVIGTKFDNNQQAVIMGIDVTEVRTLEQTITIMDKLSSLGEMVAGIIHEVNNPLAAIKASAQLIPKYLKKNDTEKALYLADKIDSTTNKISKIIRGIKSFVRRGDSDPFELIPIQQIIEDAFFICEGKFKEKQVHFFPIQGESQIKLYCKITEVFQVFVNLMTNAFDAIESLDEKWIKTSISQDEKYTIIHFTDSGSGIPEAIRKNLFKSFYTTKVVGKGTGLGLSLCKKIMDSHKGSIEVDPSAFHTTFILKFPKT